MSIDPVMTDANTGGSFNRYAYANNNPYKYIDPDGRAVESITMDKNRNVHIVLGMSYKGNVTVSQAAALNASIIAKYSGKFGPYGVTMTIIPGSQAKFGNIVTIINGKGDAFTNGNGGRETRLFTVDPRGNSMEEVLHHEVMHQIGVRNPPGDTYTSGGRAVPGWEGNISADASGEIDERNIGEFVSQDRPYLPRSATSGTGSGTQTSSSNSGPQGCMAKGGNCWN